MLSAMKTLLQGRNAQLFLVSFLILFLEIALIRWVSTEIRIFAYVNNLVLLACFLGLGIGCYYAHKPVRLTITLGAILLLLGLIMAPIYVSFEGARLHLARDIPTLLSAFSDSVIWFEEPPTLLVRKVLVGTAATSVIVALIAITFVPLGQLLGKLLGEYDNLFFAYSLNLIASLAGIWIFNVLSFQSAPPWVWFVFPLIILTMILVGQWPIPGTTSTAVLIIGYMAVLIALATNSIRTPGTTVWSPYQKLNVLQLEPKEMNRGYLLTVNDVNFMEMLNFSDAFLQRWSHVIDPKLRPFSNYDLPYQFHPAPANVLIVGAGAGNDVAGALRNGAQHVTAVEIDPQIYAFGRQFHPESPYGSPNVDVVIDDARSFLKKTGAKYDVIVFASLDSHTLMSSFNNMRIDHYVYTQESFREARQALNEDGILTVIFTPQRPWITDRIAGLLRHEFGHGPLAFRSEVLGWGSHIFIASDNTEHLERITAENDALRSFIAGNRVRDLQPVKLTTDNWPYLYLEKPGVPALHLCLSILLLVVFVLLRKFMIAKGQRINWHFFLLGTAFLLLEFQNISKSALLFGSTWLVNSFTISGILVLILLANVVAYRWKKTNVKLLYVCLVTSIVISYFLPLSWFNTLPYVPRIIVSSVLLNLPIFFAGIVFINSFSKTESANIAFGSNLLGAGVGGILESLSFLTGIHIMLALVALFYVASFVALRRQGLP